MSTAVTVRHKLQSTRTDLSPNPDPSRVSKNAWNDDHALGAAPANQALPFADSTSPTGLSWTDQVRVNDALGTLTLLSQNLGNDAAGPSVVVGRNTSGGAVGPAAGALALTDKAGSLRYLWVDANAILRMHTAAPTGSTGSPTVSDTAGSAILKVPVATFTIGDLFSPDTTTTLTRIAAVASGSVLASAGAATLPAWSATPTISGAANFSGTGTNAVQIGGQRFNAFTVDVTNTGGTLQHAIIQDTGAGVLPDNAASISGASVSLNNTPSVDSTTDFIAGVGVIAASAQRLVLNTGTIPSNKQLNIIAFIEYNDTGTEYRVYASTFPSNVNGTTRLRVVLVLANASTGAAVNWNTTTIGSGKFIRVKVFGFIA